MAISRQAVTPGGPLHAYGEDCGLRGKSDCASGLCLRIRPTRSDGSFCTEWCANDGDCPIDWACRPMIAGDSRTLLCVPPASWVAQAVVLRSGAHLPDGGVQP